MQKPVVIIIAVVAAIALIGGAFLLLAKPGTTRTQGPVIAVSVISHNEDPQHPDFPDFSRDRAATLAQRDAMLAFATMLTEHGVAYNYQTDWNFLLGLEAYDDTNFLQQLADLGVSIDAHSHEHNGYNYADVAGMIDAMGVEPSGVVGGFIAAPASESELVQFQTPIRANKSNYVWTPTVLWGAGTSLHIDESSLWISGVWRPKSVAAFTEHDPEAPLPNVGGYRATWDGLAELLAAYEAGELDENTLYTVSIMTTQDEIDEAFIADFEATIASYEDATEAGIVRWMLVQDVATLWQEAYDEAITQRYWEEDDSEETTNTSTNAREGCGNGICEAIERQRGRCEEDCR